MKVSKEIYDLVQKHDPKEIKMGIKVEREHDKGPTDVIKTEIDLLKTALAHLEEDPEYYTHLKAMEDKYVEETIKEWVLEEGSGLLTEVKKKT